MSGESLSFFSLFNRVDRIEIPILQRDYAQGRPEESEVRSLFLRSLYQSLIQSNSEGKQTLDLDFVYGNYQSSSVSEDDAGVSKAFSVLDGQQRLTTLFLLHWYLALADGRIEAFRQQFVLPDGQSRFTYKTRPSSNEFFNALVVSELTLGDALISETICDCQWFYLSWQQDPTVQACLCMLDAIQEHFAGHEAGLFERLADECNPCITFQFLDLHSFGLSDELYIKMNARGKPLTFFENFKAKLEQHIIAFDQPWPKYRLSFREELVTGYEYFIHKIDTDWADLFWPYRNTSSADDAFDDEFMHFFRFLIVVQALLERKEQPDQLSQLTQALFGSAGRLKEPSLSSYEALGCFSQAMIERFIDTIDLIYANGLDDNKIKPYLHSDSYYSEQDVFKRIISNNANYDDKLRFFAFYNYLEKLKDMSKSESLAELNNWMRVIYNLVENTITDSPTDFYNRLFSIHDLIQLDMPTLEVLKKDCKVAAFSSAQVLEEKIKAHLILKSKRWQKSILEAERHAFFNGQIGCILNFSGILDYYREQNDCNWSDVQDNQYFDQFAHYFEVLAAVFNKISQSSAEINYAWERAVLSKGVYFTQASRNRFNLLHSRDTRNNIPRDHSWRRRLRIGNLFDEAKQIFVKAVLDDPLFIKDDLQTSLEAICEHVLKTDSSEEGALEPWRAALIRYPELFDYCTQGFIAHNPDETVLLSQSQRNHYHCELFTKVLELELKKHRNQLQPFSLLNLESVKSRDYGAVIKITGYKLHEQHYQMTIKKLNLSFLIGFKAQGVNDYPAGLVNVLKYHGFSRLEDSGKDDAWYCEQPDIEKIKQQTFYFCTALGEL